MNSLIPYSVVSGTIGTLVQLYILDLHGTVVDVGLVLTLSYAVTIPAAIVWGGVTDRLRRRRIIILASFASIGVLTLSFLVARSVRDVALIYAAYSIANAALTSPINLLIMETVPKSRWASSYAKYSALTAVGNLIGLLSSTVWSLFIPARLLVVFLTINSVLAVALAARLMSEPSISFEEENVARFYVSIGRRLSRLPLAVASTLRRSSVRSVFRMVRYDFTGELRILYLSILVFFFATGLLGSAFVPLLRSKGVSDSIVFAVTTVPLAAQAVSFRYFGERMQRKNFVRYSALSLVLRALSVLGVALSAYFLAGGVFVVVATLCYALATGVAAAIYYTTSTTMVYETLEVESQGSSLGIYAAFTQVCLTVGVFFSGYVSFFASYPATYVAAAVGFALSAALTVQLSRTSLNESIQKPEHTAESEPRER